MADFTPSHPYAVPTNRQPTMTDILNWAEAVHDLTMQLHTQIVAVEEQKRQVDLLRGEILVEKVTGNNQAQRDASLLYECEHDSDYQRLVNALVGMREQRIKTEADLEYARTIVKALLASMRDSGVDYTGAPQ